MKLTMTNGNMKLPKSTLNFSLPPIKSCPGSTDFCRKNYYALKAYKQYPNVRNAWDGNFKMIKLNSFTLNAIDLIDKNKNSEQIRIHTSGDFINQDYLNKWIDIAKQIPNKVFYAYTKSFNLDFSKRPKNMIIIKSDDNPNKFDKNFDGVAKVIEKETIPTKGWYVCPGDCKTCNYCYNTNNGFKKIIFKKH